MDGHGPGRSSTQSVSLATLVDTNVLVYAHDPRDRRKMEVATRVLRELVDAERAVVSVQCLTEFVAVVGRLPEPIVIADATAQVERLIAECTVVDLTPAIVREACGGVARYGTSVWDALIWAAAKMNGVPFVLTEDAEHGRSIEGVTFLDPFDPHFDLAPLIA